MKSLIRWSATLGLIGTVLLAPLTGSNNALALPEAQIVEKLKLVPVFTITDAQGAPLTASVPNGDKQTSVAGIFISQQDAQAFIDKLKAKDPQLAGTVKVVPVSLAEVYQMDKANQNKPDELEIAYVPMKQQVDAAVALLKQQGQQVNQFNGVPMFVATGGPEKGYLTIQQGEQSIIPIFFNKDDLQTMVARFQQQQPDLAGQVQIKVVDLEGVIETLQKSDDPQLNQLVLIPPRETIEYLRANQPANPAGQATPVPAPRR